MANDNGMQEIRFASKPDTGRAAKTVSETRNSSVDIPHPLGEPTNPTAPILSYWWVSFNRRMNYKSIEDRI